MADKWWVVKWQASPLMEKPLYRYFQHRGEAETYLSLLKQADPELDSEIHVSEGVLPEAKTHGSPQIIQGRLPPQQITKDRRPRKKAVHKAVHSSTKESFAAVRGILQGSIPNRFLDMPPDHFESFVANLFRDMGYRIEQVKHGSDFGIDIIVVKDGQRTGIQVKRYQEGNNVGVADVNQAIGGRAYHGCDDVIFITTSDYTKSAKELASRTSITLLNWKDLQTRLSDVYLEGLPYHKYFEAELEPGKNQSLEAKILRTDVMDAQNIRTKVKHKLVRVFVELSNKTNRSMTVDFVRADYVTESHKQYGDRGLFIGTFKDGTIYPGCTVEMCILFDASAVGSTRKGDQVILILEMGDGNTATHILDVPNCD